MIDLSAELGDYNEPEQSKSLHDEICQPKINDLYQPWSIGKLADLQAQGFCTEPPRDLWRELMAAVNDDLQSYIGSEPADNITVTITANLWHPGDPE